MGADDDPLFLDAITLVLKDEGALQLDPHDSGNWTGGRVGSGELRGTNFGISAATYPTLDIAHLTRDQAIDIYYRDWWCRYAFFGELPHDEAVKIFDLAINMGVHRAELLLQEACGDAGHGVPLDGLVGPLTIAAANACDSAELIAAIKAAAENFHRTLALEYPEKAHFLADWLRRDEE